MSDYKGAEDEYISIEDVRTQLESVCEILDTNRPEAIVYKDFGWSIRQPRLKHDGRTIILYKCKTEADLNWQLWVAYERVVTSKSPRWIVRHLDFVLISLALFAVPNWIAVVYLLSVDLAVGILYSVLLQIPFVSVGWPFIRVAKDKVVLWKEAMVKAGLWSQDDVSNYEKGYPKYPLVLLIGCSIIVLVLGAFIVLSQT